MEWSLSLSLSRGGVVKEQSSPRNELSYLLTLEMGRGRSIYSLSHEGVSGREIQGQSPVCAQAVSAVRQLSVVRSLAGVWTSGGRRTSDVSSLDRCCQISGRGRSSGRWGLSDIRRLIGRLAAVACIGCGSSRWPGRGRVGRPVDRRTSDACSFAATPFSSVFASTLPSRMV